MILQLFSGRAHQHRPATEVDRAGFDRIIYAISRTGVTGARQQLTGDAKTLVKRIRRFTKLPIAVGFGISTPEQFATVGGFAEGAVVGSAIVHAIEQNPGREAATVAEFVRQLSAVSRQPSAARAR